MTPHFSWEISICFSSFDAPHPFQDVPISFLLHERKLEAAHEEFMKYVAVNCPKLANSSIDINTTIVIDEELAVCSSIDKWLPDVI